jgi:hypothetical protein
MLLLRPQAGHAAPGVAARIASYLARRAAAAAACHVPILRETADHHLELAPFTRIARVNCHAETEE